MEFSFHRHSAMKAHSTVTPKKGELAIAPRKAVPVLRRAGRDRLA
jgi:hypothetical protein